MIRWYKHHWRNSNWRNVHLASYVLCWVYEFPFWCSVCHSVLWFNIICKVHLDWLTYPIFMASIHICGYGIICTNADDARLIQMYDLTLFYVSFIWIAFCAPTESIGDLMIANTCLLAMQTLLQFNLWPSTHQFDIGAYNSIQLYRNVNCNVKQCLLSPFKKHNRDGFIYKSKNTTISQSELMNAFA